MLPPPLHLHSMEISSHLPLTYYGKILTSTLSFDVKYKLKSHYNSKRKFRESHKMTKCHATLLRMNSIKRTFWRCLPMMMSVELHAFLCEKMKEKNSIISKINSPKILEKTKPPKKTHTKKQIQIINSLTSGTSPSYCALRKRKMRLAFCM